MTLRVAILVVCFTSYSVFAGQLRRGSGSTRVQQLLEVDEDLRVGEITPSPSAAAAAASPTGTASHVVAVPSATATASGSAGASSSPSGTPPLPCPKGCSGNGDCVHGSCFCFPGFLPPDCSLRECALSIADGPSFARTTVYVNQPHSIFPLFQLVCRGLPKQMLRAWRMRRAHGSLHVC